MVQRLDRLLNEADVFDRPLEARKIEVTNLTEKLQEVKAGSLFFCVVGAHHDGHEFAAQAVAQGAVALVVERQVDAVVPQVQVPDVRASMAPMASAFYDHPDRRLRIFGITGTNGKTTTSQLLAAILRQHRWATSTIGTLSGQYTSPPAIELQRLLSDSVEKHDNAVVMEVSSHALVQHRADAIRFDVGIFTNLTQDHLDYHKTMAHYFEAKSILFEPGRAENAVINIDDPYGRQLVDRVAVPVKTFSLEDAEDLVMTAKGSSFKWSGEQINLRLLGQFNVYNALAAANAARVMGVTVKEIADALSAVPPVPGRMEQVEKGQPFTVLVDFAHTPDGLENVLKSSRALAAQGSGRLIVMFGCGGDRDAEKRPLMGEVAARLADAVVITTDNARSEDPQTITDQILAGIEDRSGVHVYLDRREAIFAAINHASAGDVVVLAGKGHETSQEIAGVKTPFDDRLVAAEAIQAAGANH